MVTRFTTALRGHLNGINVVPISSAGSKRPALAQWKHYQQRRVSHRELFRWFLPASPWGIGVITGKVSGCLEALDFDVLDAYEQWIQSLQERSLLHALCKRIARGYLEETPSGGRHLLYRCSVIEGNQKLASRSDGKKRKTLIETRGEGGLIIIAPSGGTVHPSGKPYRLLQGGLLSITTITPEERLLLLASLRTLDEIPSEPTRPQFSSPFPTRQREPGAPPHTSKQSPTGMRPGDCFNQRATWEEVLQPYGWRLLYTSQDVGYWQRPGKAGPGISATTNYGGFDLLYMFSTSTCFEPERGYSKFAAYTHLAHHGDFAAAAKDLASQGYV